MNLPIMDIIAPPPKTLEIETSSLCNLKCVMCPQSIVGGVPRPNHLPEQLVEKIMPYITDNTECVSLHGIGEPFLSKSFWNILPHMPEACQVQCNTNLTVLTDKMLATLISSNFSLLNVSLDGPSEDLYRAIRGFDLSVVLDNMRKVIAARDQAGNTHLKVYGNMTLMRCNIDTIIDFMDLVIGDIGCDAVQVWSLNDWGTGNKQFNKTANDWEFNYEEQGMWNHKELYLKRLKEARAYATQRDWELFIDDTLA